VRRWWEEERGVVEFLTQRRGFGSTRSADRSKHATTGHHVHSLEGFYGLDRRVSGPLMMFYFI
jgi:hypothetical protein